MLNNWEGLAFGILVLLAVGPSVWVRRCVRERQQSVQRALPFVLDLLTLSVESGLDFTTALRRIFENRPAGPLGEELLRVLREIQMGKTRRDALRDMAGRLEQEDLRSVVHALVQADELGVSVGQTLRIQSAQIRQRRFERAEKAAYEAPVRMLFPLVVFIFPAVFLVLLGPILGRMVGLGL